MQYPVMFSDADTIAEGKVMNLTVFGCAIECAGTVPQRTTLRVRLILPDQAQSLPVEEAEVRWVQGNRMGLQFHKVERAADFRLHGLCGIGWSNGSGRSLRKDFRPLDPEVSCLSPRLPGTIAQHQSTLTPKPSQQREGDSRHVTVAERLKQ